MGLRFVFLIMVIFLTSDCVEPYNFRIKNNFPKLAIEGHISNISFNQSKKYPSNGRYFYIKLSKTSDVININNEPVSAATVILYDDTDNYWIYSEDPTGSGYYYLFNEDFKADENRMYKIEIHLLDGRIYESNFEKINSANVPEIGTIGFEEVQKQVYAYAAGEQIIVEKDGINVSLNIPKHENDEPIYYRWTFTPTWVFIAPFARSSQPGYKCWVGSQYYLKDYTFLEDNVGGYKNHLFFIETTRNDRIYEEFSVLITQYSLSKEYFNFWKELNEQTLRGGLFDEPPYNLNSNITCTNCDANASGYFAVVGEKATRWYFVKKELSYNVINTLKADCSVPFQDPGPECFNCLAYPFGNSTDQKPIWWRE